MMPSDSTLAQPLRKTHVWQLLRSNRWRLIMTELDLGLTFVTIAAQTRAGSPKRIRNGRLAREAYDGAHRFAKDLDFSTAERDTFERKKQVLEAKLARLSQAPQE